MCLHFLPVSTVVIGGRSSVCKVQQIHKLDQLQVNHDVSLCFFRTNYNQIYLDILQGDKNYKMTETVLEKNLFDVYFSFFSLVHVISTNMEEAGFLTYTTASHQGAYKVWLLRYCHFTMRVGAYCSEPVGGDGDTLASLLGNCHCVHVDIQFMAEHGKESTWCRAKSFCQNRLETKNKAKWRFNIWFKFNQVD